MSSDDDPAVRYTAVDDDSSDRRPNDRGVTNLIRPGEFVYEVSVRERDARMTVSVTEPSGDERTVGVRYEAGTGTFDTTVTGGSEAVRDELATTPVAPFVSLVEFPSIAAVADFEALPTERRLPVPGAGETATVEVTQTVSGSGAACYRSAWRYDGVVRYADCIAPRPRLKTAATYYTTDAEPFVRVELAEPLPDSAR